MARKFADIGTVKQSKSGSFYIQLDEGVEVTIKQTKYNGDKVTVTVKDKGFINLDLPENRFSRLFRGDEEKIEERLEKLPDYVKFFVGASEEV